MAYVQAPLKKVVGEEMVLIDFNLSQRRDTVTARWKYDRRWTLECGHAIRTPDTYPRRKRMRCYECKNGLPS